MSNYIYRPSSPPLPILADGDRLIVDSERSIIFPAASYPHPTYISIRLRTYYSQTLQSWVVIAPPEQDIAVRAGMLVELDDFIQAQVVKFIGAERSYHAFSLVYHHPYNYAPSRLLVPWNFTHLHAAEFSWWVERRENMQDWVASRLYYYAQFAGAIPNPFSITLHPERYRERIPGSDMRLRHSIPPFPRRAIPIVHPTAAAHIESVEKQEVEGSEGRMAN
ncbi:hypothetical protein EIP86_006646 [Pleurotus ostreatoroseus]|nr:hypothetical protein EIP86_006646 [Pleurotus ostreatoroseus]